MASSPTSLDLLAPVHRLSVDDYMRMGEAGIFDGGPRVELIEGIVVEMSPTGTPHLRAVMWLNRVLVPQLGEAQILSPQQAISLPELKSMPEPDVAVLEVEEVLVRVAEQPLLVVEVSDSSLGYDRLTKSRIYAQHCVPEYWVLDVKGAALEIYREPTGDAWGSRTVLQAGDTAKPALLPGVEVDVGELLAFTAGRG